MKPTRITILIALAVMACSMTSCITTETTLPDGTVIRRTEPAAGAVETAAVIAHEVLAEK